MIRVASIISRSPRIPKNLIWDSDTAHYQREPHHEPPERFHRIATLSAPPVLRDAHLEHPLTKASPSTTPRIFIPERLGRVNGCYAAVSRLTDVWATTDLDELKGGRRE